MKKLYIVVFVLMALFSGIVILNFNYDFTNLSSNKNCSHINLKLINKKETSCSEAGYTGDLFCPDCKKIISEGKIVPMIEHETEIRNQLEPTITNDGYTGDVYCKKCGNLIDPGNKISKLGIEYTLKDGSKVILSKDQNIGLYTMSLYGKKTEHQHENIEKQIFDKVNYERQKAGVPILRWSEEAYYFTKIRAEETIELFSHTRPNGTEWHTVYTDNNVVLDAILGENLAKGIGISLDKIAEVDMKGLMNSPTHKENILKEKYKYVSIAVVSYFDEFDRLCHYVAQNFIS